MTRTARSSHPRAILKDRWVDIETPLHSADIPHALLQTNSSESRSGLDKSLKKGGAGAHSWGDLLEDPSLYPADDDGVAEDNSTKLVSLEKPEPSLAVPRKAEGEPSPDSPSVEEVGFPSPKLSRVRGVSVSVSYTDEDLALAKRFRTRVFSGGSVDLSTIARTSPAVANPANLDISPSTLKHPKSFSSTHSSASDEH